jgi:group I intron endonuclease
VIGIYKIINKVNGTYYIGSSIELDKPNGRWYKHKRALLNESHFNDHLQSAWNKYGPDVFDFIIVEETTADKLIEVEQRYLDIASKEKDKCYNQNFLAERGSFSEEIIKKRVASYRKYYSANPNPMLGKKHSKETKEKIRQKAIGRKLSDITKEKLSKYKGAKNGFADKIIYSINNPATVETFRGLRSDFIREHNISPALFTWALKKQKPCKGWVIALS